ncbi:MAG TPA: MarR family transcriptional regulator [Longimicrobiales bacterium]
MNDRGRAEREALLLGFLRAAQVLERRLEESFAAVDLTAARYWVLELLGRAGRPLPLREIAERLSCVRSNVTQLVDRLEADGLVRRIPDPADRRGVLAELTPAGRAREREGAARLAGVLAAFESALSPEDRAALGRVLDVITR